MFGYIKNFSRTVNMLIFITFFVRLILLSLLPFLPFLLNHESKFFINLSISSLLFGDVISGVFWGILGDKTCRRKVLYISLILLFVGCLLLNINLLIFYKRIIFLSAFFIIGSAISGTNANIMALLTFNVKEINKKELFEYKYWISNIASLFGLLIG